MRGGINEDVTQTILNKAYDLYNEIYEEYELDKKTFVQILKEISILFDTKKDSIKFFKKQTHLYTLIVYTYYIISKDLTITPDIIGKINRISFKYTMKKLKEPLLRISWSMNINYLAKKVQRVRKINEGDSKFLRISIGY